MISGIASPHVHCLTKGLLGIPKELEIVEMMALGYPPCGRVPSPARARRDRPLRLLRPRSAPQRRRSQRLRAGRARGRWLRTRAGPTSSRTPTTTGRRRRGRRGRQTAAASRSCDGRRFVARRRPSDDRRFVARRAASDVLVEAHMPVHLQEAAWADIAQQPEVGQSLIGQGEALQARLGAAPALVVIADPAAQTGRGR